MAGSFEAGKGVRYAAQNSPLHAARRKSAGFAVFPAPLTARCPLLVAGAPGERFVRIATAFERRQIHLARNGGQFALRRTHSGCARPDLFPWTEFLAHRTGWKISIRRPPSRTEHHHRAKARFLLRR